MNAGRVVREWRRRAGLTQRDLAERTAVAQPVIARIERGHDRPRVDTLTRLLAACGATLTAEARRGAEADREAIRGHLALGARDRLGRSRGFTPRRMLDVLLGRRVDFVLTGDVAARLRGLPARATELHLCIADDLTNRRRLARAVNALGGPNLAHAPGGRRVSFDTRVGPLRVVPPPGGSYPMVAAAAWVVEPGRRSRYVPDAPLRVASIDDLIREAEAERRWDHLDDLWALRELSDA